MPRTEAGVDAALFDLERERERIQAVLAAAPARETALLDQDADDAEFLMLDVERKRNERALERLDRKEAQLVQVAERLRGETRQAEYQSIRERYRAASYKAADDCRRLMQSIALVNEISREADRFAVHRQPVLPVVGYSATGPYVLFDRQFTTLLNQPAVAERTPRVLPIVPRQFVTYSVRFLEWTEVRVAAAALPMAFQRGQIAGFTGSVCRRLVAAGKAEWMKPGMAFDPWSAMWGAGPAPPKEAPQPEE